MRNKKIIFPKLSFVLLFVILYSGLFSQINVYKPFPLSYGSWIIYERGPFDFSSTVIDTWILYETNGDTIIGSQTYKKVITANSIGLPSMVNGIMTIPFGPRTFGFAYRNNIPNKKVFIYTNIAGQFVDTLWYDFNLTIGDTLKKTYSLDVNSSNFSSSLYSDRRIVTSIDSLLVCGIYHKIFHFGCGEFSTDLTEGIGFTDNFLNTSFLCPFEPLYIYDTRFSCSLTSIKNEPVAIQNQIEVFPNPVIKTLQINYTNQNIVFPLNYFIVDCLGKLISRGTYTENANIDVRTLKKGIYFLSLKDKQGNLFQSKFVKE
ncbi:MAG: hypothetical protein A3F72_07240 [Bacteroidetes bacterium RIFCSPLOWO2_12_FULL_35_15]|nr:MAG: hypothetical protein A3F72_07240 [Bacteroidetes bacterium RIFCSPLOWO2_12_FULL_35_15]